LTTLPSVRCARRRQRGRPARQRVSLLGRKVVPLIDADDALERAAGMIQDLLDHRQLDLRRANPLATVRRQREEPTASPVMRVDRHLGVAELPGRRTGWRRKRNPSPVISGIASMMASLRHNGTSCRRLFLVALATAPRRHH
jgi:hypothetical protein